MAVDTEINNEVKGKRGSLTSELDKPLVMYILLLNLISLLIQKAFSATNVFLNLIFVHSTVLKWGGKGELTRDQN